MQRNNFWVPTVIATGRTAVNTNHHVYLELKDCKLENHKLLCECKFDNLDKMDEYLNDHKLPKVTKNK